MQKVKGLGLGGTLGLVVVVMFVAVIALIFAGPMVGQFVEEGAPAAPGFEFAPEEPQEPSGTACTTCPDDGTTTINVLGRNPANASLEYTGATVYYVVNGRQLASATLNSGGSGTAYKQITASAVCGDHQFYLQTLDDSSHTYFKAGPFTACGAIMNLGETDGIKIPESSEVQFKVYDDTWTEVTNSSVSPVQDAATVTAISVDTTTADKIATIRASPATSSAWFGSDLAKPYICSDFDLSYYSKTGVILQGGGAVEVTELPLYCANNAYEKAWQINPVKSSTDYTVTVQDVLQDPGTSQDLKFIWVDQHAYEKTTGIIAVGTADDLSNDVGETNRYVTISIS